ncbi:unknown function family protein DUF662, partial [Prunus dulcis]
LSASATATDLFISTANTERRKIQSTPPKSIILKQREKQKQKRGKERGRKKVALCLCEEELEEMMQTEQAQAQQQQQQLVVQNSAGSLSFNSNLSKEDEEMSRSALSTFRAKEEEIERKKMEVREKVQAQLGRVEEETKRLATIREELEGLADPMRKEVSQVRKKIDSINKELKPLGHTCQKKEKEYRDALEAFNEKNREKVQLITKLMEVCNLDGLNLNLSAVEPASNFGLARLRSSTRPNSQPILIKLVSESEKLRMKKLEELSKNFWMAYVIRM